MKDVNGKLKNGLLRDGDTTMGMMKLHYEREWGWKKENASLKKGQMLYYNFIRPHTTLDNKTPAEKVGIGIKGNNKWMELLKKSLKQ